MKERPFLDSKGSSLSETSLKLRPEKKELLSQISQIRHYLRCSLIDQGFIEVEIPVFSPSPSLNYGGIRLQTEKLGKPIFLTTAGTPYIRRLIAEGVGKVFCISKNFRDDQPDATHYPEFETLNLGIAYHDYKHLMSLIEAMCQNALTKSAGKNEVLFGPHGLSFKTPWSRVSFKEATLKYAGKDLQEPMVDSRGLEWILERQITPNLVQPTFLTEYPCNLFGPAKAIDNCFKERAEIYAGGIEIGNISTFENDAEKLERWYEAQMHARGASWDEFQLERLHLESVKRGLPPCTTGAIGLTRFYMVLLGQENINNVVTFPWLGQKE